MLTEPLLDEIASYLVKDKTFPEETYRIAKIAFLDSLGCAVKALNVPACTQLLPPWYGEPKRTLIEEAFSWTLLIRYLDYNDTWLGLEWAHPSDNIGSFIALLKDAPIKKLLHAMIEAYEIQGILSLSWSCNERGLDHTYFLKIASGAVVAKLLGGDKEKIVATLSHLFVDNTSLRTYRHAPNTTSRKCWAAADAVSRALFLATLVSKGEPGIPFPISEPKWGVEARLFGGEKLKLKYPLDHLIMDNILFKVRFPIEFHAQTAVEAALYVCPAIEEIEKIEIYTHAAAKKIIDKTGPLNSPADRDHCIQYGVAIALLFGGLTSEDFEDEKARDPRIDALREKMVVIEDPHYTALYHDPEHRSIPNRLEIYLKGNKEPLVTEVLNPLGHPERRKEALPLLKFKLQENLRSSLSEKDTEELMQIFNSDHLQEMKLKDLIDLLKKHLPLLA